MCVSNRRSGSAFSRPSSTMRSPRRRTRPAACASTCSRTGRTRTSTTSTRSTRTRPPSRRIARRPTTRCGAPLRMPSTDPPSPSAARPSSRRIAGTGASHSPGRGRPLSPVGRRMFRSPGAIAFHLGPLEIRWYGILTAASIALGLWLADRQARAENLPAEEISRCAWWAVVTGYLGARLYEVAFNWDYYGRNPWKILAVWEGGLAIHGGFIVGGLVGAWLAARRGLPVLRSLDVAAPSLAIAQALGRWGNFFNEEAFGRPTDLPWAVYISPSHRPPGYATAELFHPTFLYESLWDLGLFVLLVSWLRPRFRSRPGVLFFSYIGLYSVGRFAIEALRLDSFWVGEFRVAQLASLVGMAFAAGGLLWVSRRDPVEEKR